MAEVDGATLVARSLKRQGVPLAQLMRGGL